MPSTKVLKQAVDGMSFDKYIDNPNGGATVITNRKMYKDMYQAKFDKILLREQGDIQFKVYHQSDANDTYYIHFKIPSEPIANFYYDVVIQLSTKVNEKKANDSLRQYMVRFYSNDPAFVYTFVHAFAKHDIFIKDCEPKMSKTALRTKARTKNPNDDIFYVKSLYFAYLAMERYGLFYRHNLDRLSNKYSKHALVDSIEHADKKIKARQEEGEKLSKKEERYKERGNSHGNNNSGGNRSTSIKKVSTVKTAKTVRTTRNVKRK